MSNQNPSRGEIIAALSIPTFMSAASRQTGSELRRSVSERLHSASIDVVVVAANAIGASLPFPGAEVVWQNRFGGEFTRQLVSWSTGRSTVTLRDPSGAIFLVADCAQCGQRNELHLDLHVTTEGLPCSQCGAQLIATEDTTSIEGHRRVSAPGGFFQDGPGSSN